MGNTDNLEKNLETLTRFVETIKPLMAQVAGKPIEQIPTEERLAMISSLFGAMEDGATLGAGGLPKSGMILHANIFPEADEIARVENPSGTTPQRLSLAEFYCVDPKCDCRRVIFRVMEEGREKETFNAPLATLSYGWESTGYYKEWGGVGDMCGISIEPFGPQSPDAEKYRDGFMRLLEEGKDADLRKWFIRRYDEVSERIGRKPSKRKMIYKSRKK